VLLLLLLLVLAAVPFMAVVEPVGQQRQPLAALALEPQHRSRLGRHLQVALEATEHQLAAA
jgi:hypothetical protein